MAASETTKKHTSFICFSAVSGFRGHSFVTQ
jgi:hypothetical protein